MQNTDIASLNNKIEALTLLVNRLSTDLDDKDKLLRTQLKIMEVNLVSNEPKQRIMLDKAQISKIKLLVDLSGKGRVSAEDNKKVGTFESYVRNGERENFIPFVTRSQQRMLESLFRLYLNPNRQESYDDEDYDDEYEEDFED